MPSWRDRGHDDLDALLLGVMADHGVAVARTVARAIGPEAAERADQLGRWRMSEAQARLGHTGKARAQFRRKARKGARS